ncbi:RNA polymerase sigma factor [Nocardioides daphniae]|uniref:DNA-directed RNA polymerase sigma-70 factor n=1 Tax=Nocardioides daphniae TaxID=402297 RepID=A0ABQ1Q3A4_9ACTN|nr:RNA polymerase sigma factor [Nocardioides daphniae]GGD11894.1 DNA-directed RNA polymerase sigma-70 factor [Nocardioides daphniae]
MKDDATVARAKQGDADAWRTLYRQHGGRLIVWLQSRPTGDTAAAPEDVAAEAWFVAAQKIADFHGSATDFAGWLFGIARRISATAKRTSDRRATSPGEVTELVGAVDGPHVDIVANDWVRSVLATLPPRERSVIGLVDGLGIDTAMAAEILGISTVALRVARHRGLKRLKGSLGTPHLEVVRDSAPHPEAGPAAAS